MAITPFGRREFPRFAGKLLASFAQPGVELFGGVGAGAIVGVEEAVVVVDVDYARRCPPLGRITRVGHVAGMVGDGATGGVRSDDGGRRGLHDPAEGLV